MIYILQYFCAQIFFLLVTLDSLSQLLIKKNVVEIFTVKLFNFYHNFLVFFLLVTLDSLSQLLIKKNVVEIFTVKFNTPKSLFPAPFGISSFLLSKMKLT